MLLKGKTAAVFAATGAIGTAVATRLAEEGARVFVSGRDRAALQRLGNRLDAPWEQVDATDEQQVAQHLEHIERSAGIDIVFNAIGLRAADAGYASPSTALPFEQFLRPLQIIAGSQFITARAAARLMLPRQHGTIVTLSASLSGNFIPFMAGITAACGAIEAMTRTLAAELGPAGIRVNCVRSGGMPETRTIQETQALMARTTGASVQDVGRSTMSNVLQRPLRLEETASMVAFVASDRASGIAGQVLNVCAGAIVSR